MSCYWRSITFFLSSSLFGRNCRSDVSIQINEAPLSS